jgi:hypothetical protein
MNLLFLLSIIAPGFVISSTGGNCQNVCQYQIDNYWTPCIDDNCPQIGELLCPTRNATTCTCSQNCQMCVDDLYNECGGCSNKYGYDFDKEYSSKYKKLAEDMGCNKANKTTQPLLSLTLLCILLFTIFPTKYHFYLDPF